MGTVREFSTDWKIHGKSYKILENSWNVRQIMCIISKMDKFSFEKKILEMEKKILEKSGEFC